MISYYESAHHPNPPIIIMYGDLKFTAYLLRQYQIMNIIGRHIKENINVSKYPVKTEYG